MAKSMIRQNKNFLQYPTYVPDDKIAGCKERVATQIIDGKEVKVWIRVKNFKLISGYKLPAMVDQLFMYYYLMNSQRNNWSTELEFSRYEILRGCGLPTNNSYYERLGDSLERLTTSKISFDGTFTLIHKDKRPSKVKMMFGYLDSYQITKGKQIGRDRLQIRISKEYIEVIRKSGFTQNLDFEHLCRLRKPTHMRIYELLSKNFYQRSEWKIDAMKMAEQIPISVRYPREAVKKIRAAVIRINSVVFPIEYSLHLQEPARGKIILVFKCECKTPWAEAALEDSKESESVKGGAIGIPNQQPLPLPITFPACRPPRQKPKEDNVCVDQIALLILNMIRQGYDDVEDREELEKMKEKFPRSYQAAVQMNGGDDGNGKK